MTQLKQAGAGLVVYVDDQIQYNKKARELFQGNEGRVKCYSGKTKEESRTAPDRPKELIEKNPDEWDDGVRDDVKDAILFLVDLVVDGQLNLLNKPDEYARWQSIRIVKNLLQQNAEANVVFITSHHKQLGDLKDSGEKMVESLASACQVAKERVGFLVRGESSNKGEQESERMYPKLTQAGWRIIEKTRAALATAAGDAPKVGSFFMPETREFLEWFFSLSAYAVQRRLLDKAAPSKCHVLITGPTGSGKELAAMYLHEHGLKPHENFEGENITAYSDTLLESELFGHVEGAFTGATREHIGLLERVGEGTLLLDEIGDMKLELQTKLLRVIQRREFTPVGAGDKKHKRPDDPKNEEEAAEPRTTKKSVKRDFIGRLVVATQHDLWELANRRNPRFRKDLYYRLSVVEVPMPSLASVCEKHKEVLIELFARFVNQYKDNEKERAMTWTSDVLLSSDELKKKMGEYEWPGNIRELDHFAHKCVVLQFNADEAMADIESRKKRGEELQGTLED